MQEYKNAVGKIMDFLDNNQYCSSIINGTRSCLKSLETYLLQNNISYSPETADTWFESIQDKISVTYRSFYRVALARLHDVYEIGSIGKEHYTKHLMSYTVLDVGLKQSLDTYLLELGKFLSPETIDNHKHTCARFLIYVQKKGVGSISDITYEVMCNFYEDDIHSGKWGKGNVNGNVSAMMQYYFCKGGVPYGFTVLFHYLSFEKGCFWNDVDGNTHKTINSMIASQNTVSVDELHKYQLVSNKLHSENEYSKSVRTTYNKAADLLILFLDINGYRYSPDIAMVWLDSVIQHFSKEALSIRRALCLIAQYHDLSEIKLESVFRIKSRAIDLLPEWCKEAAERYIKIKIKEGWKQSTVDMIRASICRFCNYLNQSGVHSFMELNASYIKQFNLHDIHKTAAGKNAYNVRIRKFLIYLGEYGYLSNPMLFISLACTNAPKETIVVVLTEQEMSQLNVELHNDDSKLSLRKKAMLLLGLKMGLRSSDIVKLQFDDIDWNTASISFIQDKTEVEVNLPMPIEVGNALFHYIMEERHRKSHPKIFLSEKAPHKPVGRSACGRALHTALPDRNVDGSGFHVTRKTYATHLLRNGVGVNMVADALGQRGIASVHRYLSLDTDRMRMCSLSLKDFGIGGWRNGR